MASPLFAGPGSLRDPYERLAFWGTALCALPIALLIGYLLHESIGVSQVALFIVVAMVYVTLARGRLLGSSVRLHETQYPRVFRIVKDTCAALEIPMPLIFAREDNFVPVAALGFGEPYSLVLSTRWIELFADDELQFMIGRELGHIAAGHTRFLSLLSVNGNENPLISLIFGAWLRRCATTCDKIGLLCCGSVDAAIRAIGVATFHEFGRKVDYQAFAEQQAELAADPVSRWGVLLGSEPYATTRLASLQRFLTSFEYQEARRWFVRERGEEPPELTMAAGSTVEDRDCAGWWRRFASFAIDSIVVMAIIGSFAVSQGAGPTRTEDARENAAASHSPRPAHSTPPIVEHAGPVTITNNGGVTDVRVGNTVVSEHENSADSQQLPGTRMRPELFGLIRPELFDPTSNSGRTFWLGLYMILLVTISGQTFGMMIAGLRVVTTDFHRPGIVRTIFRYALAFTLLPLIALLSLFWRRVLLHDRWTKTRVIKTERVLARATGTN